MARHRASSEDLEQNSRIGKMLAPGPDGVAILRGFIGPSEREGYIRLFASLANTSVSVEIAEANIVDTADMNNQLGKRIVWVRKGTKITVIKTPSRRPEYGVRVENSTRPEPRVGAAVWASANGGEAGSDARHLRFRLQLRHVPVSVYERV